MVIQLKLRVLIDTNVFIYRENDHIVPLNLQNLFATIGALRVQVLVHPRSIEELRRDRDNKRRQAITSKIGTYSLLEFPPGPDADEEFLRQVGPPSTLNDEVDDALLYAVYRDAVHYLVTEDKEIQKKSERVGLRQRVLSVDEALKVIQKTSSGTSLPFPPALAEVPLHNLRLDDPFFDSLKSEYSEFEDWFRRVAQEGRRCLAYREDSDRIGALMISKVEEEAVSCIPPLPAKKRLKISTLKVVHTGYKIGELFIRLAVHDAIAKGCEEIYLTYHVKANDDLVRLVDEYGFEQVGKTARGEQVFLKEMMPHRQRLRNLHPTVVSQKFYPTFCDGTAVKKFLVPIRPEFHQKLFVDYRERQTTLPEYHGQFVIPGNTIKKAYLCNSNNKTISKGDIMLFYRSVDRQEITSLGVVERVHRQLRRVEEVGAIVEKRTVYSIREIGDMLRKPTIVFLFTWHFHLQHPLKLEELKEMGISVPQTISRVSHRKYLAIRKRGMIDERFAVN